MIMNDVCADRLSLLGFGTMRLPLNEDKTIDENAVADMVEYALAHGVNYFDTAYPYHGGKSEIVIGKVLSKYPRESYRLATKYPGHQIAETYDASAIFEEQLAKCGVEYFDYYLLHNVCERSMDVFCDPKWGIVDYLVEQKKLGRIKHLGFSSHGKPDNLKEFLDLHGDKMEFCQIQLNYLDWTLQDAKTKYEMLTERGIPVWVMEPVRGGKLASLNIGAEQELKKLRPDAGIPSWAFRWLMGLDNVKMILSGMSNMEQMTDNVKTFETRETLTETENALIMRIADGLKNSLPCTACRYCVDGCPMGLDIPSLISAYNDLKFSKAGFTVPMLLESLDDAKRPSACIGCGACANICPQKIDVPSALKELDEMSKEMPSWNEICKQRAEAAKKAKA